MKRKIVFLTGTRADYGKIKSILRLLNNSKKFEVYIYVTGMHMLDYYGNTYREILKDGFKNVYLSNGIELDAQTEEKYRTTPFKGLPQNSCNKFINIISDENF